MTQVFKKITAAVEPERQPLTAIPGRLTAGTVRKTLHQIGIDLPRGGELQVILASGKTLADSDIRRIDAALDAAKLPIVERLRFKHALTMQGLLPKGRPVNFGLSSTPYVSNFRKFNPA